MKAVVLVGGEGTRLRPLTETIKKALLPLMDRPSLAHVLDHLGRHGVTEVVLSSPTSKRPSRPSSSRDRTPRGDMDHGDLAPRNRRRDRQCADPVGEEPFFALNGDILTDLDLTAMLAFHRSAGRRSRSRCTTLRTPERSASS